MNAYQNILCDPVHHLLVPYKLMWTLIHIMSFELLRLGQRSLELLLNKSLRVVKTEVTSPRILVAGMSLSLFLSWLLKTELPTLHFSVYLNALDPILNLKLLFKLRTSNWNCKFIFKLQLQTSTKNFNFKLQLKTSTLNFIFKLQT